MIDTHAHLNFPELGENVDSLVSQCQRAGIAGIVVPGTDVENSLSAIECADRYEYVFAAVGIHPLRILETPVGESFVKIGEIDGEVGKIEALAHRSEKVVAIGEIGLDYYHIKRMYGALEQSVVQAMHALFVAQFELARRLGLSIIIHSRDSAQALMEVMDAHWDSTLENKVVIHCCEADDDLLAFALNKNMFIGVDGDVTFIKKKQRFIQNVPLDRLVLETDSPFLMPSPIRNEVSFPNSPIYLGLIRDEVARIHGETAEKVDEITTHNARVLFGLDRWME